MIRLVASGLKEDTLRIRSRGPKAELQFTLTLPTLCITYADMRFQNAVGGVQANFPGSRAYAPVYFDPPVTLNGEEEIEKFTYIRGASRVVIGPKETRIEFPSWKELVIPRLRLDAKEPAQAVLSGTNVPVDIDQPLTVLVRQYADGRHVGGATLEARHPKYQPPEEKPFYNLWVRVIDGRLLKPLEKARIGVWHWSAADTGPFGPGIFLKDDERWGGPDGGATFMNRPAGEWEAVVAQRAGWRVTPRVYRPLAGQPVQLTLRAWEMQPAERLFTWPKVLDLGEMGERCGGGGQAILALNGLPGAEALKPGVAVRVPCFAGALCPEGRESLQDIVERFRFKDQKALAKANGLGKLAQYDGSVDLQLPGWHFFYARPQDTLEAFDRLFDLSPGSCVPVGRVFRPYPGMLYDGEVVGVPS
jgi:hypothetical protein